MWNTTSWSQILQAQQADLGAIKKIYEDYTPAIQTFLLRRGFSNEDVEDYTQSFFIKFIENKWIQRANPRKGRFRTFLLTLLTRFVNDQRKSRQESFERDLVNKENSVEEFHREGDAKTAEVEYHQAWAESLLEMVLDKMRCEIVHKEMNILDYEVLWLYFFAGSPFLQVGDLKNPQALFQKIMQTNEGFWNRKYFAQTLKNFDGSTHPSILKQRDLIVKLNQKLSGDVLFDRDF